MDRDGVINRMVLYKTSWDSPQKPKDVRLVPNIEKIISWANKNKIPVVEVSNQPGVAKGKMTQEVSDAIEARVHELLKEKGAVINKAYICPHHPNAVVLKLKRVCNCRKPKPGLILRAKKELHINLRNSIFLGDKASDAIAGRAAGVKTVVYLHHEDETKKILETQNNNSDYKVDSIKEAFQIIQNYFKLE